MEYRLDPPTSAKDGNILTSRHNDPLGKNTFCGIQNSADHWLTVKIRQQLIAAKPLAQAGCHNDAADVAKGFVQIHNKGIFPAAQFLQKG